MRLLAAFGADRTPFRVSALRSLDVEGAALLADWCHAVQAAYGVDVLTVFEQRLRDWAARTGCSAGAHRRDVLAEYLDAPNGNSTLRQTPPPGKRASRPQAPRPPATGLRRVALLGLDDAARSSRIAIRSPRRGIVSPTEPSAPWFRHGCVTRSRCDDLSHRTPGHRR